MDIVKQVMNKKHVTEKLRKYLLDNSLHKYVDFLNLYI